MLATAYVPMAPAEPTYLYASAQVLILLDTQYIGRFWTLTEAWCSMQTATREGVRCATGVERRYYVQCIHNANPAYDPLKLRDDLSNKTPDEMHDYLAKSDVQVDAEHVHAHT